MAHSLPPPSHLGAANPLVRYAHQAASGTVHSDDGEVSMKAVKEQWIRNQLRERESEFCERNNITVMCCTWNVNGKRPTESLLPWLQSEDVRVDIYCIAFQELDLTPEALLLGDTSRALPWETSIESTLAQLGPYKKVHSRQLVGMLLCVFALEHHMEHITEVKSGAAGVGVLGLMGNKGGVSIRFQLYDSTQCFVNTHLSAHFDNIQRRNQDYKEVCRRIIFDDEENDAYYTLFDHDQLFWCGDLNYRLNLTDLEVRNKVKQEDWGSLFEFDQLQQQMKTGAAFDGFHESAINFAPTYKYDPGTAIYDTSEKHRTPAWCDRVLFQGQHIVPLRYERRELLSSDHRPVCCTFAVQTKVTVPQRKAEVYQAIVKELDKMENETLPDAVVSENSVIFRDVRYMTPQSRVIVIENTGQVLARFRFIPKLDEKRFCKPWLWVNPPFGMMIPGESISVELTVCVDNATAPDFNYDQAIPMEDILILHLEGGKDHFISVSGNYIPTCCGCFLDQLVRHPLPIREGKPIDEGSDVLVVPKELLRLVEYLAKHGLKQAKLFLEPGDDLEVSDVIERLDTGASLDDYEGSVLSVGEAMLRFLDSLADPLIPFTLYNDAIECSSSMERCCGMISALPKLNSDVFHYLIPFLLQLLEESHENDLSPESLAMVFANVLIRPPPVILNESAASRQKKTQFILHFLRAGSIRGSDPVEPDTSHSVNQ